MDSPSAGIVTPSGATDINGLKAPIPFISASVIGSMMCRREVGYGKTSFPICDSVGPSDKGILISPWILAIFKPFSRSAAFTTPQRMGQGIIQGGYGWI